MAIMRVTIDLLALVEGQQKAKVYLSKYQELGPDAEAFVREAYLTGWEESAKSLCLRLEKTGGMKLH